MSELGNCRVCGEDAISVYPLLPGSPAFCSEHHNSRDAGPFGCDFSGPDDFDIPTEEDVFGFHKKIPDTTSFDRETFIWKDKESNKHSLKDIDNTYLSSIISYLRKRLATMDFVSAVYWSEVIVFLGKEQKLRLSERVE